MATRVFISYSHDSPEHMERVLGLANRLRGDGVDCVIDQYEQSPAPGWPRWTMNEIEKAAYVLVVCTETYDRRFRGNEPRGVGRGAKWEGAIITQEIYDAERSSTKFVPVITSEGCAEFVPVPLRGGQHFLPFDDPGYEDLYRLLTNQPRVLKPELGKVHSLPPLRPVAEFLKSHRPGAGGQEGVRRRRWLAAATAATITLALSGVAAWKFWPRGAEPVKADYDFEYYYFKDIPYALFHTMRNERSRLYWLKLIVANHTKERLFVDVTCEVLGEPKWATCADRVASYAVEPGAKDQRRIEPYIEPVVPDSFTQLWSLSLHWKIVRGNLPTTSGEQAAGEGLPLTGRVLHEETVRITVHPEDRFFLKMANDKNEEVEPEFLLASLAGWTKTDAVADYGRQLAVESRSAGEFVRRVYTNVLQGEQGIRIEGGVAAFPPAPFEEIRPAKTVWTDRTGNPLEVALLVGAMGGRHLQRLGGLVLVWSGREAACPGLFLAWRAGTSWRAVDLTAITEPFEVNEGAATATLARCFTEAVEQGLDRSGVYLDLPRLGAVDFTRAAREHGIEGIP